MSLINKSEVKKVAIEKARYKYKNLPCYIPTCVSKKFLDTAELTLLNWINHEIETRPAKGKTL